MTSSDRLPVWVSLPRNDIALAEAAIRGGATGIKVHLNAFHRASGTRFGSYSEERPFLQALSKISVRKAIMIGQEEIPSREEMEELRQFGFEGFNLYLRYAKPHLFESGIRPILALEKDFTDLDIKKIREFPDAWVEASMIDPALYGQPLTGDDFTAYTRVVEETRRPVLVPTQKNIRPDELPRLKATGIAAILIGVIVAGTSIESIENATREFVRYA